MTISEIKIGLDDEKWPFITAVVYVKTETRQITMGPTKFQFDQVHVAVENMIHNALSPALQDLLKIHNK